MKLNFERKPKVKMIGTRVTQDEYNQIEKLAKLHDESIGETCRVLIVGALNEVLSSQDINPK